MVTQKDVNDYVDAIKEAVMASLADFKDGYYIYSFGALIRVPKQLYTVAKALGGTTAQVWSRTLTPEQQEYADIDAYLEEVAAEELEDK